MLQKRILYIQKKWTINKTAEVEMILMRAVDVNQSLQRPIILTAHTTACRITMLT